MKKVDFGNGVAVHHVIITGGPCAGKTTALSAICEHLTKWGFIPLIIDEVATQLISTGIKPGPYFNIQEFEKILLKMQLSNEEIYHEAAERISKTATNQVVIVQDRSILEVAAYTNQKLLETLLYSMNKSLDVELQKYVAAIHLVTAANGALHAYSHDNNQARSETPEEARELDQKTYDAYINNMSRVFRINNQGGFSRKILDTLNALNTILGLPLLGEKQKKFFITREGLQELLQTHEHTTLIIRQTYLIGTDQNSERRLRMLYGPGSILYSLSETVQLSTGERVKTERMISETEYVYRLSEASPKHKTIEKTRYCININHRLYVEIDQIFSESVPHPILEVKALGEEEVPPIHYLPGIMEEITDNRCYLNKEIARL